MMGHIFGLVDVFACRNATRKIRKRHPEIALGFFMDDGDVICHGGPQLNLMPD